jgi:hypothetical protein
MAGHRRSRGRGPRARAIRLGHRLGQLCREAMAAPTAESQLAAAYDFFRMTAKHNPDVTLMHEIASALMAAGARLEPVRWPPGMRAELAPTRTTRSAPRARPGERRATALGVSRGNAGNSAAATGTQKRALGGTGA